MKRIIIICFVFLMSAQALSAQDFEYDLYNKIDIRTYYDSNVLNLSDKDINEFLDGQDPDKYKLKSVDDIVSSFDIELGFKHNLVMGHTQISKFKFSYDKYWKNGFKDFKFISFELIQYFSKYVDVRAKYSYYPYIFINKYKSNFYSPYEYHDFTYSKNLVLSGINIRILDFAEFGYNFKYSNQNYNEYFPEYDAYNLISGGWIGLRPMENTKIKFKYTYVQSIAKAEKVYEPGSIEIRDPSYDSNIFYTSLSLPIGSGAMRRPVKLFTSLELENRYYQSPFSVTIDPFHSGRKDNIMDVEVWIIYPLWYILDFRPFFTYESRNTHSPNGTLVSEEKGYITRTYGVSLQVRF
ncbi:MAG: hypothetical protein P9L89_03425 [Candidatus Celaenobacter polaris]|nr:hypothetical protein [Candidatus Celaenobacter polaris]